jgi:hypothetical protein
MITLHGAAPVVQAMKKASHLLFRRFLHGYPPWAFKRLIAHRFREMRHIADCQLPDPKTRRIRSGQNTCTTCMTCTTYTPSISLLRRFAISRPRFGAEFAPINAVLDGAHIIGPRQLVNLVSNVPDKADAAPGVAEPFRKQTK